MNHQLNEERIMTPETYEILVWPDGYWCEANMAEEESAHKSDDFVSRQVPYGWEEEDIDLYAEAVANGDEVKI
jgi:hypothetical protein